MDEKRIIITSAVVTIMSIVVVNKFGKKEKKESIEAGGTVGIIAKEIGFKDIANGIGLGAAIMVLFAISFPSWFEVNTHHKEKAREYFIDSASSHLLFQPLLQL